MSRHQPTSTPRGAPGETAVRVPVRAWLRQVWAAFAAMAVMDELEARGRAPDACRQLWGVFLIAARDLRVWARGYSIVHVLPSGSHHSLLRGAIGYPAAAIILALTWSVLAALCPIWAVWCAFQCSDADGD